LNGELVGPGEPVLPTLNGPSRPTYSPPRPDSFRAPRALRSGLNSGRCSPTSNDGALDARNKSGKRDERMGDAFTDESLSALSTRSCHLSSPAQRGRDTTRSVVEGAYRPPRRPLSLGSPLRHGLAARATSPASQGRTVRSPTDDRCGRTTHSMSNRADPAGAKLP
jgi:hypothetical protein